MRKTKATTIGIPKALLYHKYFYLWKSFFESLDCKVVVSPETNVQILKNGINVAVDESCLALKIFLGHVEYLKDKVDYILLPRIASLKKGEQTCTKFTGLFDIVNNSFENIKLLDYNVDVTHGQTEKKALVKAGFALSKNWFKSVKAYNKAKKVYLDQKAQLVSEQEEKLQEKSDLKILIVSHPYTIYDGLVGSPIIKFLNKEGVTLLFSDRFDQEEMRKLGGDVSHDLYWTDNKEFLGAIEHSKNIIDGIIYTMSFPCGPDALVIDFAQKKFKEIPSLVLTIDELQGEAGLMTRLESFVDILRLKKAKRGKNQD